MHITSCISLFLIIWEKYMVTASAGGGRQDFNFTFFCHFARPVSLILNFIAQKIGGGRKCRIENLLWLALLCILVLNLIDCYCVSLCSCDVFMISADWTLHTPDSGHLINMIVCMSEVFGTIQGGAWYFHLALNIHFFVDYPIPLTS